MYGSVHNNVLACCLLETCTACLYGMCQTLTVLRLRSALFTTVSEAICRGGIGEGGIEAGALRLADGTVAVRVSRLPDKKRALRRKT